MSNQVECPSCNGMLQKGLKCVVCDGTRVVDKELFDRFYGLAKKLRHETQIPHKFFEVESLLLYNVSLSEDPNRYQEYAVYKRGEDGGYINVESVTMNGASTKASELAGILMSINKQSLDEFGDQIRIFDDQVSALEFEVFKERFAAFESSY